MSLKNLLLKPLWSRWCQLVCLCVLTVGLSGCSLLSVISDFDPASLNQMQLISKKIDRMFITLQYSDKKERQFAKYKSMYIDVAVEINALKSIQMARSSNELTMQQVATLVKFWQEERKAHQTKDTVPDIIIKLHHSQYNRLMMAMIKGEEAKPQDAKSN